MERDFRLRVRVKGKCLHGVTTKTVFLGDILSHHFQRKRELLKHCPLRLGMSTNLQE